MPLDEFIKCLDTIINQITEGIIPCDKSIVNTLLDNTEIIYQAETGSASDYYMTNYRLLASEDNTDSILAVLNLISGHLKLIASKNNLFNRRNNEYHKLRCVHSKFLNDLKVTEYRRIHPDAADFTDAFKGKGCIYTVITGGYDSVKTPAFINEDMDYILFTDNPNLSSDGIWQVRILDNPDGLSPHMLSRHVKVFPHKYLAEYDYSLYIDGNLQICGDVNEVISTYHKKESMLCNSHDERDCIYDEAVACIEAGKDSAQAINPQIARFLAEGYPEKNGLIIGGYLIRSHHDDRLNKVMEDWWTLLTTGSKRDQLSFNYVAWKNDYMYDSTDLAFADNDYFIFHTH